MIHYQTGRTAMSCALSRLVLAALALCALRGTPADAQSRKSLSYDQIFKGAEPRITRPLPSVTGWADDRRYLETKKKEGDEYARIYAVDAETGKDTVYRDLNRFKATLGQGFDAASPASATEDFTKLIYVKDKDLYFLDVPSGVFRRLTETTAEEQNPTISPTGNAVAFTRGNDLYVIDLATGNETRCTQDGSPTILNGYASWLYYEEVLGRVSRYRAFWWSPDGTRLLFFRFDDAPVPVFSLAGATGQHGYLEQARYPKAGDPNPRVRAGLVAAGGGPVAWADLDDLADQYLGTPFWSPDSRQVLLQWMNRSQDTLKLFALNPKTGKKREVYTEHQPSWVEWIDQVTFLKKGKEFLLLTDRDGWMHLYHYGADGTLLRQLTKGEWSVAALQTVDEKRGMVYFTAKKESPTRTDLYRVGLNGKGFERLTFGPYTHTVRVSPAGECFTTSYSNAATPSKLAVCRSGSGVLRELGDSKTDQFEQFALAKTEVFTIPASDGLALPASWVLPVDFDPAKKYPVLISIYGGPLSAGVADRWGGLQDQWLAQEGMIMLSVDHRGSGAYGKQGAALMHRRLGYWEMRDYGDAALWLKRQPFVDTSRICITGGSYGGYVTCLALTAGAGVFTHGVALFSVTDWRLYDSHYTERYMDTPEQNPEGYREASVMAHAGKYRGGLFIVHGTMDDNVHMQNSIQLIDTLQNLNRHFEFMVYPGERHGWGGPKAGHLRMETYRFYYRALLNKQFPEALFSRVEQGSGRPRRRE
jgi:dipeptidyl-peptidase 4